LKPIEYIQKCIELAEQGRGFVNPNPLVGSVVVHDNVIIGEGWHKAYGLAHAERMAIDSVENKELLRESTLYVTLEPCSHFGKTPPCTHYIVEHRIPNVVVSMYDPNPLVSGKGIAFLEENGVNVSVGLGRETSAYQNRFFLTHHTLQRPYIQLKWAESADGFIAPLPKQKKSISGESAYKYTHSLRQSVSAVLVGVGTWQIDQPQLTDRLFGGPQPLRIVLDPENSGNYNRAITDTNLTLVINQYQNGVTGNCEWVQVSDCSNSLDELMRVLYDRNINSLLVEGGANTLNRFINEKLFDEMTIYKSKKVHFNRGVLAPEVNVDSWQSMDWDEDVCCNYSNWILPSHI